MLLRGVIIWVILFLHGCTVTTLQPDQVAVYFGGTREVLPAKTSSLHHWPYAVMANLVYHSHADTHDSDYKLLLRREGWIRWNDLPKRQSSFANLNIDVWQRSTEGIIEISVVFEGTRPTSLSDWISNLNIVLRVFPWHKDEYTEVMDSFNSIFKEELKSRFSKEKIEDVKIYAVGHSLGGGLAQLFAYSFSVGETLKVERVYAFNSSPITGYFLVNKRKLERTTRDLDIDRVYLQGEILSYLRNVVNFFSPPSFKSPRITRYEYGTSIGDYGSIDLHSSAVISCQLISLSGVTPIQSSSTKVAYYFSPQDSNSNVRVSSRNSCE